MADYNSFAEKYDFWIRTIEDFDRYKRYLHFLPTSTSNALDVGCGAGWLSFHLSDHFENVFGVDISSKMIELAKNNREKEQKENVDFAVADIESIPFKNATFDFIVSDYTLNDTQETATLPELVPLLKPGGRMMLRDFVISESHRNNKSLLRYILTTLKGVFRYIKKHGLSITYRLVSFELSPFWIQHSLNQHLLSSEKFKEIYRRFLPGCKFEQWGGIITVFWEAPEDNSYSKDRQGDANESYGFMNLISSAYSQDFIDESFLKFDRKDIERSIPDRFDQIVKRYADRIAVKHGRNKLTYKELDKVSNRVAHAILAQQGIKPEPVALLLEHGIAPIIAILGVLKSGKFYFALDPSYPQTALDSILKNARATLLVTDDKNKNMASQLAYNNINLLNIDQLESRFSDEKVKVPVSSDSLAAIFYTSGSTGQPKGVVRNHRAILHSVWNNANNYGISFKDRHSFLIFCGFSLSVPDIFDTLLNGATLYPYNNKEAGLLHLADWLINERITVFCPPVTLFRQFLRILTIKIRFPELRLVILSGDIVYKKDVILFRKYFPLESTLILNMASSEAGLITFFPINRHTVVPDDPLPAGYPVKGKKVLILDEKRSEVGLNTVGEIAVKSRYLSLHYWRQPELTRHKFIAENGLSDERIYHTGDLGRMRPDGCLEILGRKDFQTKIRGYRIELTEIEAEICNLNFVKDAVVVVKENFNGEKKLVAYWVHSNQYIPTSSQFRELMSDILPEHKIPSLFIMLDNFPLTSTGKVDRQRLPDPERNFTQLSNRFNHVGDSLEFQLTKIWQQVFDINPIGVHENFFDIGGDSILGMHLVAKIEENFSTIFSTKTLWQAPTIAKQAKILSRHGWRPSRSPLVPVQPSGSKPPFFYIPPTATTLLGTNVFIKILGTDQPFYGFQSQGLEHDDEQPHDQVGNMAAEYIHEIQQIQKEGPYFFGGMCFGGIIAFEMAQQLVAKDENVALLAIFDTMRPPGYIKKDNQRNVHYEEEELIQFELMYQIMKYLKRAKEYWVTNSNDLFQSVLKKKIRRTIRKIKKKFQSPQMARIRRVKKADKRARKSYVPKVYNRKITCFWSSEPDKWEEKIRFGWRDLSREELEIHYFPSNHQSILNESNTELLAEKFRKCLIKAQIENQK